MRHLILATAVAAALPLAGAAEAQSARMGVRAGILQCDVGGSVGFIVGSSREVACTYRGGRGRPQTYVGSISKFGLDVGVTRRSTMVWQVVAPSRDVDGGDLAGRYNGVSAGAALGVGGTANVLVGGNRRSVNLQPLSVEGQRGVNIAAGVASLSLRAVEPAARARRR